MNMQWECIQDAPRLWILGMRRGNTLVGCLALVIRQPNGSWEWHMDIDDQSICGIEPSRKMAIEIVNRQLDRTEKNVYHKPARMAEESIFSSKEGSEFQFQSSGFFNLEPGTRNLKEGSELRIS